MSRSNSNRAGLDKISERRRSFIENNCKRILNDDVSRQEYRSYWGGSFQRADRLHCQRLARQHLTNESKRS